jgi:sialic acid synthase SpsE
MSKEGVYICAETGVNWNGDFDHLKEWIGALSDAKVDAVKIQVFDELTIKEYPLDLKQRLREMILGFDEVWELSNLCKGKNVDLVVTPMYIEAFDWLKDISIQGLKIRAKDWYKENFIEMQHKFNCPMYISIPHVKGVRLPLPADVEEGKAFFRTRGNERYRLYCVPQYPPKTEDIVLGNVGDFDGMSIHSKKWYEHYAGAAMNLWKQWDAGTRRRFYLEAHVLPWVEQDERCIDEAVSLNMHDLQQLVWACTELEDLVDGRVIE